MIDMTFSFQRELSEAERKLQLAQFIKEEEARKLRTALLSTVIFLIWRIKR